MNPVPFRHAFTLVEVVIVIGLFTAMMLLVVNFYVRYINTYGYDQALVNTATSASAIVNEVTVQTLPADRIMNSYTASNGITYTTGTSTLVLEIPSIDSTGTTLANTFDYVIFYTSSSTAYRLLVPNAASKRTAAIKQLGDVVTSLTFTYETTDPSLATWVSVDVQTQVPVKSSTAQSHLTQQIYLRNVSS